MKDTNKCPFIIAAVFLFSILAIGTSCNSKRETANDIKEAKFSYSLDTVRYSKLYPDWYSTIKLERKYPVCIVNKSQDSCQHNLIGNFNIEQFIDEIVSESNLNDCVFYSKIVYSSYLPKTETEAFVSKLFDSLEARTLQLHNETNVAPTQPSTGCTKFNEYYYKYPKSLPFNIQSKEFIESLYLKK